MRIELTPSLTAPKHQPLYSAKMIRPNHPDVEILDAPRDIATRWAEAMNELHGGEMAVKRVGVCRYCGGTRQVDAHCADCNRVF